MEIFRPSAASTFISFPIIDADGDLVTAADGLDETILQWSDGANPANYSFQPCAFEVAGIASSGWYALQIAATELPAASPYVAIKVTSTTAGAKPQNILIRTATLYANVQGWNGANVASPDTAGYPVVTIKDGTGAGEIQLTTGTVDINMAQTLPGTPTTSTTGHALSSARFATDGVTLTTGQTLPASPTTSTVGHALSTARFATDGVTLTMGQTLPASPTQSTVGHALMTARMSTHYIDATISSRATPAQVNTEVLDVLNTDTFAEPAQGAPAATTTLVSKLGFLYKAWRNRHTQTSTQYSLYADDATTIDQKSTSISDDGTTFDRPEVASGP